MSEREKRVCLDPGHDAGNLANKSPDGTYYEHVFTLDLGKRLEKLLTDRGVSVTMTRTGGGAVSLARRCEIELAYAIGVAHPLSVMVDTHDTGVVADDVIEQAVEKVFDLRPGAIIRDLDLRRPIFEKTAAYGPFGRNDPDFTWEATNRVDELKAAVADLS